MSIRLLLPLLFGTARACSNIIVTGGASADGNPMVGYNADSAALHGAVSHWPHGHHAKGAVREVFSWDLGIKLGEIPEAAETYNVIGNANCQGLVIGETTLGGLAELSNVGKDWRNGTILDYGQLIYITLQRAATAREAIKVMHALTAAYGYASDMEGLSLSDATTGEAWYMELIGKGGFEKGALWVALRVPEGHIMAHANQARITRFLPCDDEKACLMAPDVVSFAIAHGYFHGEADDPSFSFSDVYDPVTFEGARFCEARVWSVFSAVADPASFDAAAHLDYAQGRNLTNRMPLFVKPKAKLTRAQVHSLLSLHYEDSWLSPYADVGAGAEHSPYRWNGLTWEYEGKTYVNERVVGTQYTAWHWVAQLRRGVPKPMGALQWWGADDHTWAPKIPLHGGASAVHSSYDDADCTARAACRRAHGLQGNVREFSLHSAWWLANLVADQVYAKADRAAPLVRKARAELDAALTAALVDADDKAARAFAAGDAKGALATLTDHAVAAGAAATARWTALWQELLVSFIDGRVTAANPKEPVCECTKESATFSEAWKAKVVADTGDHYLQPPAPPPGALAGQPTWFHAKPTRSKLSIPGVAH